MALAEPVHGIALRGRIDVDAGPGGSAPVVPVQPAQADLDFFADAMRDLESVSTSLAPSSARSSEAPLSGGVSRLEQLSDYLSERQVRMATDISKVLVSRDSAAMLQVTAKALDNSVESDLLAKVIGKTVSAVDQLTKLN